jgi:hypothetical protein
VLWGGEGTLRDRLREGIADLKFARRVYHFEYPFRPDAVVEFFRTNYGPMSRAFASLDVNGQERLRSELVGLWSELNKAAGDSTKVEAEYLEVIATRGSGTRDVPTTNAAHKMEDGLSRRAGSLANRIEEGSAALVR